MQFLHEETKYLVDQHVMCLDFYYEDQLLDQSAVCL